MNFTQFNSRFSELCMAAFGGQDVIDTSFLPGAKISEFTAEYYSFKVQYVFRKNIAGQISNLLYCRIYPVKTGGVYYLLPEVFSALGINEFRTVIFHSIDSPEMFENCFKALDGILREHFETIKAGIIQGRLPVEPLRDNNIVENDDITFLCDPDGTRMDISEIAVLMNYTEPLYSKLAGQDREKALKKYEKRGQKGRLYSYQRMLLDFVRSPDARDFTFMPDGCRPFTTDKRLQISIVKGYVLSFLLTFSAITLAFVAVLLISRAIISRGAETVIGMPIYYCFLFAALPAFAAMFVWRKKLFRIVAGHVADKFESVDPLVNGRATEILSRIILTVSLGFSCFGFALCCLEVVCIYGDGMSFPVYNSDGFPTSRQTYSFEQITGVYYISARYNDYGDRIERPSYVIKTGDGFTFDFDGDLSAEKTEKLVIPVLEAHGISVTALDSEKDIP